jgi:hypothetical protein
VANKERDEHIVNEGRTICLFIIFVKKSDGQNIAAQT